MHPWLDRYEEAAREVELGLAVIARQRAVIDRLRSLGQDTTWFEQSLKLFERSQILFQEDLQRVRRERH